MANTPASKYGGNTMLSQFEKSDLSSIARDWVATHTRDELDNATDDCERTYPDVAWNSERRAFLINEIEYFLR